MAKNKKKTVTEKVTETVKSVAKQQLLRDANTGAFYKGSAPKGKSQSGTMGGEPYWEV
jgi:hypothetical protein